MTLDKESWPMSNGKLREIGIRATTEYRKATLYLLAIAFATVVIITAIAWAIR
jgi:hypothetical protein